MLRKKIVLLIVLFFCSRAYAESADTLGLAYHETDQNSQFLLGVELTELSIDGTSLNGAGVRFGYEYGFSDQWSILPAIALVTGLSGSQGYLYSGIEASFRYSLFGRLRTSHQELLRDGHTVISQTSNPDNRLSLSAGLEQLFLNGTTAIYPASGFTFGVAYSLPVFKHWSELSVRDAQMTSGSRSVSVLLLDFSFLLGL